MSNAAECRRRSDDLRREAMRTQDLDERSRLINQAIHFNALALEAEPVAGERRRSNVTVVPFGDQEQA